MLFIQLDLQFFSGEKTEKATPRRRQESRKKGQVLKSMDLNTAVMLLLSFGFLKLYGSTILSQAHSLFYTFFTQYILVVPEINNLRDVVFYVLSVFVVILLPVMAVCFVAAAAINYAQVGILFTTEPLQMKLSKIDPIQGFKRIYSLRALVEFIKSILKILFVGAVTFSFLYFKEKKCDVVVLETGMGGLLDATNVVKTTVFIKSMDDFATINGIYSKYFEKDCPARSCVEISRLPKDVLLEMEAIAVK